MNFLLAIMGLGGLAMLFVTISSDNGLGTAVLAAAFLAFAALWKWKKSIPEETWTASRFKYRHIIRMGVGLMFFVGAMLQLGTVARTFWANYFGEESSSANLNDIFPCIITAIFALALIGYERVAGILFAELFFSTMLGGVVLRLLAGPGGQANGLTWVVVFTLAFGIVFALGQWFHWSKGFALGGMVGVIAFSLWAYLTM